PSPTSHPSLHDALPILFTALGMIHLLNLLAAIALLVWATQIVRTGVLRVWGENLRKVLAGSFSRRVPAAVAGLGVTSLVQSSTATCLIVTSFVDKGLVTTAAALAVMLGADVGSRLMTGVFSRDVSLLSPLRDVACFRARWRSGWCSAPTSAAACSA